MASVRAVTVIPGTPNSLRLEDDWPEPAEQEGPVLVEAVSVGICGTDQEIVDGDYGTAPPDAPRLVLGHESLGRVVADSSGTFKPGDLVAGIVREPDPEPCPSCAVDEWDMCRNGRYTEHGIKELHGFARDRWRLRPEYTVRLEPALGETGVLLEPTSVVAKAWDHVERIGSRSVWQPRIALITGAGPVGLLAAMLAAQRGLDVHVLDRVDHGPKPELVRALGATYHAGDIGELDLVPDVVIECTGAPAVVVDVMFKAGPSGIVCLAGVSTGPYRLRLDAGLLSRDLVLENNVVFGSVNANRRHWEQAATGLAKADGDWLNRLITRRLPVTDYAQAYRPAAEEIKVVLDFAR